MGAGASRYDVNDDEVDDRQKNGWSYFLRAGIFLCLLSLVFQFWAVADPNWVQAERIEHAPGGESIAELSVYGTVIKAQFGIFSFCLDYPALEIYGNNTASICWEYTDDLMINGETRDSCTWYGELCDTATRVQVTVVLGIVLIAMSDVVSEKAAVASFALVAALITAITATIFWTQFIADFKGDDAPGQTIKWGSGLTKYMFGLVTMLGSAIMMIVAFYCWDFDEHDKWLCGCINYLYEPNEPGEHKPSALSQRQQFFKDGVGPLGRLGAFCGLATWVLCLLALSTDEWIKVTETDISRSLAGMDQLNGGGKLSIGSTYKVRTLINNEGNLVDAIAYAKFEYKSPVFIKDPNGTVISQQLPLDDVFESYEVNFDQTRRMATILLIMAAACTLIGDLYSEYTHMNGVLCLFAFAFGTAAAVFSFGLIRDLNDLSPDFVSKGTGVDLMLSTAGVALLGGLTNLVDARIYGLLQKRAS